MISSCRCYGVPDLLRVPSPSSCRMGPISKDSADTVLVSTLLLARCSSSLGPEFVYRCRSYKSAAAVDTIPQHCITSTQRVAAIARTHNTPLNLSPLPQKRTKPEKSRIRFRNLSSRKITNLCHPMNGLRSAAHRVYITAQIDCHTLVTFAEKISIREINTNNSARPACLPAIKFA